MHLPIYHIDAFTRQAFAGNPAAVMFVGRDMDAVMMQKLASENNLSETAFLIAAEGGWQLRWFTPTVEVDLCGHATLASAHALFSEGRIDGNQVRFFTASGELVVSKEGEQYTLDFPACVAQPCELPGDIYDRLGFAPIASARFGWQYLVAATEQQVRGFNRDFSDIAGDGGVIITAHVAPPSAHGFDLVSRYFGLRDLGIKEDPVTGSAHCVLVPFWADRLNKQKFKACQASVRGGELMCEFTGARVRMTGNAITYSKGEVLIG